MRKKIPATAARIGMYVDGFDTSWFKTPFLRHHFEIKSQSQLEKIQEGGFTHLFIDTDKGLDALPDDTQRHEEKKRPAKTFELKKARPSAATQTHSDDPAFSDYIRTMSGLIQIDKLCLVESSTANFDIFEKTGMDAAPISLPHDNNGGSIITKELLASSGDLLINRSDVHKYRDYLRNISKDSGFAQSDYSTNLIIKETAKILIRDLFNDPKSTAKMEACKDSVEHIISSIMDTKGLINNLFTVNKHDYYVYTHSVNVAVFCVATALAMGIQSESELFAIGLGCLLHDIGMSTLPPEVLYKPTQRLTEFETNLLRGHIFEGLDIVNMYRGITLETIHPLVEHHENLIGTGYPMGLKGDKLHLSGKIISITNTYDILTTSRPGFKSISPYEALAYLRDQKEMYDAAILKEFITVLGKSSL
ncbi:MAG: DUF3391 domain-containing protein [Candidatus Magnetominusculus sp. LBB02]|nr:DUF3391 domain-containing protein [Candidatus Magnetominusculus sp. LBB02]